MRQEMCGSLQNPSNRHIDCSRPFRNQVAMVSGASRGLGFAIAEGLARGGAHVVAIARTAGALEALDDRIRSMGGTATLVPLDIADSGGIDRLGAHIGDRWGRLDLWVHAAIHAPPLSPVTHSFRHDWDTCLAVNVGAVVGLLSAVTPLLERRSGLVVHVDDAVHTGKFHAAYQASKAAQGVIFETWSREQGSRGPELFVFSPRPMPTGVRARFFPGEDGTGLNLPEAEAKRLIAEIERIQDGKKDPGDRIHD